MKRHTYGMKEGRMDGSRKKRGMIKEQGRRKKESRRCERETNWT
jgi:hypothetical protein